MIILQYLLIISILIKCLHQNQSETMTTLPWIFCNKYNTHLIKLISSTSKISSENSVKKIPSISEISNGTSVK